MPEAISRFDRDFASDSPRRATARKPSKSVRKSSGLLGAIKRRPMRSLYITLFVGTLTGIVANAAFFQNARHPAPLFSFAHPAETPAAAIPAPAPRPTDFGATQPAMAPTPPDALRAAQAIMQIPPTRAPAPQRDQAEAPSPKKDQIAALLKSDAPAEPSSRVAAAQRALQKVGFVVKPDGLFRAATRQAIEKFERDRGLSVTGELSGRTIKELSAQSGVVIP